jgi:hypothetical protein
MTLAAKAQPKHPAEPRSGQGFDRLAAGLERGLEILAASVLTQVRAKHPGLARRGHDWDRFGELTSASIRAQLRSFRSGILPERCPEVDVAAVAALAPTVGLPHLLDGYRLSQLVLWQAWFELVEDSLQPTAPQRRELLSRGSDFFFRYADLLSGYVTDAYQRHLAPLGTSAERRLQAIAELLDGDPLAASWLDLDLERHHLGLLAWGEGAEPAARGLATELGRPLFLVASPDPLPCCWAWISGTRPLEPSEERRLACFQPAAARIAVGLEAFGEAGFCSSHRQALRALRFAPEDAPPLLRYEDVVVEALACENEDDARAFVARELRGIEDDSARSRRLRETLAAYFAAEYNAASAGARLGIHQQTVANRLRVAEERLGHTSIGLRRVELEMALRLRECLAATPSG